MPARYRIAAVACTLALWFPAARAVASEPALDPQRVSWRELAYRARKMGLSAAIVVRLDAPRGAGDGAGPTAEAGELLLESTTDLPRRVIRARERIAAADARAVRIVDTETGAKYHRKTYTLMQRGFMLDLLVPASAAEASLPPERWTRESRTFSAYPSALAPGSAVTGPVGLIYAASAASLTSPGDAMTVLVLVQTNVERVTLRVAGTETAAVNFSELRDGGEREVRGTVQALRLVASSQPVDPEATSAFRIFGLGGDVELLWDPVRRLPVEIAGSVKILGRVKVDLVSATLR